MFTTNCQVIVVAIFVIYVQSALINQMEDSLAVTVQLDLTVQESLDALVLIFSYFSLLIILTLYLIIT